MKSISPNIFAKAFMESARDKSGAELDAAIARFLEAIKKYGAWSKRGEIVRQIDMLWRREHNKPLVTIESARRLSKTQESVLKENLGGSERDYEYKINPALIAGARVKKGDLEIDGSLAHVLKNLFPKTEK